MMRVKKKFIGWGQVCVLLSLLLLLVLVLFPFWLMIIKSFKDFGQELEHPLRWTSPLVWDNYVYAFEVVKNSILNSFFVCGMEVLVTLLLSSMGAFAFSRFEFRFKTLLYSGFLALMMIPSVLTLTAKYVMVAKDFGLYGTYLGIILPQGIGLVPFGILLLRGYFDGLPKDLFDAAQIDGANSVKQFFSVCMPLGAPMLITLALMNFMTAWNDYLWPLMILGNYADKYTIPVMLQSFTSDFYKTEYYYGPPLAGSVIVSIPMFVLFALCSKQFIRGMTSGAVKM